MRLARRLTPGRVLALAALAGLVLGGVLALELQPAQARAAAPAPVPAIVKEYALAQARAQASGGADCTANCTFTGTTTTGPLTATTGAFSGSVTIGSFLSVTSAVGGLSFGGPGGSPVRVVGSVADGAGAIGVRLYNATTLATAGSQILAAYSDSGGTTTKVFGIGFLGDLKMNFTDGSGTSGDQTINKPRFKAKVAAAATTITVTNSVVAATSSVLCTPESLDTTCKSFAAVPAAGSVAISCNAAATAATPVSCVVFN